ncbi:hypothetical protein ABZV75_18535 [Streptomyces flaveolus]|uniref:hypothetical protein n=1 Tax=Streptomyces flaveolus TaxID=67297 RepID=UPI0033BE7AE8
MLRIGEAMQKLKKVAAVAVMVGGLGLVGGGVASANGHNNDDLYPAGIKNLQSVECDQDFDAGTGGPVVTGPLTGESRTNIGNFCTVIGSLDR